MKIKQLKELKGKTKEELRRQVEELEKQAVAAHLDLLRGKSKNTRIGRSLRKDIAQIKTIIKLWQKT